MPTGVVNAATRRKRDGDESVVCSIDVTESKTPDVYVLISYTDVSRKTKAVLGRTIVKKTSAVIFSMKEPHARRIALLSFLAPTLGGGCATHEWIPGPGMSQADLPRMEARCSLMARHAGDSFAAYVSPSFVAGAELANGISEAIRTNEDYNDCMVASGAQAADQRTLVERDLKVAELQGAKLRKLECLQLVNENASYAPIKSHVSGLTNFQFTTSQLTDDRVPTPARAEALTRFSDDRDGCFSTFITVVTQTMPSVGSVLSHQHSEEQEELVQLIRRQTSWGDAARKLQQIHENTADKLKKISI